MKRFPFSRLPPFRTHTSGEELDRFSGYSEEPEPYHPPMPMLHMHHPLQMQAAGQQAPPGPGQQQQHQRRRHPAQHQPNPRWDRVPPAAGYAAEGGPEKAAPR